MTTFNNAIFLAVNARIDAIKTADMPENARASQLKQIEPLVSKVENTLIKFAKETMNETDFRFVAESISNCDQFGKGKEQVKTIVKIVDVINNVTKGVSAQSNNFNVCIHAMLKNGNAANRAELVVAQSKQARDAAGEKVRDTFTVRSANYSIGTGDSQASQVLQVLRILGFAEYEKGKKNAPAVLNQYGINMLSRAYLKLQDK